MRFIEAFVRDVRHGARLIGRAPFVAAATIVTLAAGIGLDAGVFTLVNGGILRSRVEKDPSTFARIYAERSGGGVVPEAGGQLSIRAYRLFQSDSQLLESIAAWSVARIAIDDAAQSDLGVYASCNFFRVYGLERPLRGRLLEDSDCAPSALGQVVLISEELWTSRFERDPQLVGASIALNHLPFTVIGIVPADFAGRLRGPGVWIPFTARPALSGGPDLVAADERAWLWLEGRLRAGHSRREVETELNVLVSRLDAPSGGTRTHVLVTSGALIEEPDFRTIARSVALLVLFPLTLLLLVACANVAVLLLSRSFGRRQEMAIRLSLGATRASLLRMVIVENLLCGIPAGAIGFIVALQVPHAVRVLVPTMPHYPFNFDWPAFAYLGTITIVAATIAAAAPMAECIGADVWTRLRGRDAVFRGRRIQVTLADLLVVAQVAFSVVLLVGAGLFLAGEQRIFSADVGLETERVIAVPVRVPQLRASDEGMAAFHRSVLARLSSLPFVDAIAWSDRTPIGGEGEQRSWFRLAGQSRDEGLAIGDVRASANYLATVGIPLIRGRGHETRQEDAEAIVVSQATASALWPGRDPVDQILVAADGARLRVIGVARDTRTMQPGIADPPQLYRLRLAPSRDDVLIVRLRGGADPASATAIVRDTVRAIDPQAVALPSTLRAALDQRGARFGVLADMLTFVAVVAAALALVGVYGVVSYTVKRRTREFGIRAALGASGRAITRLVFVSGLRPVMAGIVSGIALAAAAGAILSALVAGTPIPLTAADPRPYAAIAFLMVLAAFLAMLTHARRAARIAPVDALREE